MEAGGLIDTVLTLRQFNLQDICEDSIKLGKMQHLTRRNNANCRIAKSSRTIIVVFEGYAAGSNEATYTLTLAEDGPHLLDIRNRAERNAASSGYKLRFKSLVTAATTRPYDLHTIQYTYDALSRLLSAKQVAGQNAGGAPQRNDAYTFDVTGNRLSETETVLGTPTAVTFTYNAANQLTSDSRGINYSFDSAGRRMLGAWDRADRLLDRGVAAQYTYNGLGQRIKHTTPASTSDFLLDVQPALWQVLTMHYNTDANIERHVHGPEGAHSQNDVPLTGYTAWKWHVQDGLGSVRAVVDDALNVVDTRQYTPYGERFSLSGTPSSAYGFTGAYTDQPDVPFVHLRARYYDGNLGTFPSLDPLEKHNRYQYVSGNPTNQVDPSGWQEREDTYPINITVSTRGGLVTYPVPQGISVFRSTNAKQVTALLRVGPQGFIQSYESVNPAAAAALQQTSGWNAGLIQATNLQGFKVPIGAYVKPPSTLADLQHVFDGHGVYSNLEMIPIAYSNGLDDIFYEGLPGNVPAAQPAQDSVPAPTEEQTCKSEIPRPIVLNFGPGVNYQEVEALLRARPTHIIIIDTENLSLIDMLLSQKYGDRLELINGNYVEPTILKGRKAVEAFNLYPDRYGEDILSLAVNRHLQTGGMIYVVSENYDRIQKIAQDLAGTSVYPLYNTHTPQKGIREVPRRDIEAGSNGPRIGFTSGYAGRESFVYDYWGLKGFRFRSS